MKHFSIHIPLAAFALALTAACSSDDEHLSGETTLSESLVLFGGIDNGESTTRSTTYSASTWTVGDIVSVRDGSTVKKYKVTDASKGRLEGFDATTNTHHWPNTSDSKTISAWYVGDNSYSTSVAKQITVAATQTADVMQNCDFLFAPKVTVTYANRTSETYNKLTFYHQMAKVIINVKRANEVSANNYAINSVTLGNSDIYPTGTFAEPASGNYGTWGSLTGTKCSMSAVPRGTATSGYDATYDAIIVPQTITGGMKITVGMATLGNMSTTGVTTLSPGNSYTYNITVDKQGLTVLKSSISGWTNNTSSPTIFHY